MEEIIRLSGVSKESIVDGVGIRYVIFTQGCPHHCEGCHNPQTHSFTDGYNQTVQSLFEEIKANPLLRGITLSGGEPFEQAPALIALCKLAKSIGKDVWAYSGYTYEELLSGVTTHSKELIEQVDVLVDGKFVLSERDMMLRFRGSRNQRVIDCRKSRECGEFMVYS